MLARTLVVAALLLPAVIAMAEDHNGFLIGISDANLDILVLNGGKAEQKKLDVSPKVAVKDTTGRPLSLIALKSILSGGPAKPGPRTFFVQVVTDEGKVTEIRLPATGLPKDIEEAYSKADRIDLY
jgi:hypothetical protein